MSLISSKSISEQIYTIRGKLVMLDRDLADLYGVPTKRLGEQVRRNPDKFPEDFMFRLTPEETVDLRSQFATANISNKSRVSPTVFTEHGILMLANVLNSSKANYVSVQIIRVFIKMRDILSTSSEIIARVGELERQGLARDKTIEEIFLMLKELASEADKPMQPIGFTIGQH